MRFLISAKANAKALLARVSASSGRTGSGKPEMETDATGKAEKMAGQKGWVCPTGAPRAYTTPQKMWKLQKFLPLARGGDTPPPVETVETVEVSAPAGGGVRASCSLSGREMGCQPVRHCGCYSKPQAGSLYHVQWPTAFGVLGDAGRGFRAWKPRQTAGGTCFKKLPWIAIQCHMRLLVCACKRARGKSGCRLPCLGWATGNQGGADAGGRRFHGASGPPYPAGAIGSRTRTSRRTRTKPPVTSAP